MVAEMNYVRVYSSILDDEKFADIGLASLGAWLRLLIYADEMYPAPAPLPRWLRKREMDDLASRGLIDLCGEHYRMHGLEKERERRGAAASQSARMRWSDATAMRTHSERNADAMLAKQSLAEPSRAEQGTDIYDAYYQLTARQPSKGAMDWLDRLVSDYGSDVVVASMVSVVKAGTAPKELLGATEVACTREMKRRQEQQQAAAKRAAQREKEVIESMPPEQREANLARLRDEMKKSGLVA